MKTGWGYKFDAVNENCRGTRRPGSAAALEPCLDAPSRSTPLTGQYVNGDLSASIDSLNTRHFLARAFEDILTGGEGPH